MTISSPFLRTINSPIGAAFGLAAAASTVRWSLLASGVTAPAYTPTYTGPATFWAPDNLGVFQNMGGLANSLGQRIPPVAGARLATTEAGGAVLGSQLVDSQVAATWTVSGTNTVANDGSEVKITCVDNQFGANLTFSDAKALTADLVIGRRYSFSAVVRVNAGSSVIARVYDGAANIVEQTVTSTTNVAFSGEFVALATATCLIGVRGMGAGEIIWFSNISIKEVIPVALTTDAGGAALTGMQMVLQPSVTNKVTCRKRNPTDITNLTKGGDAASTLAAVASVAALGTTLGTICSVGNVYKLDNSAGVAIATATAGGTAGNTNKHSLMVWARKVSGTGISLLQMSGGEASVAITGTSFARFVVENVTPGATTRQWQIVAGIGDVLEFILPSMTETMAATAYPVVDFADAAAAVTFTATDFSYPNPLPVNNWQFRTKVKVDGTPTTDMWLWSDGTVGCYLRGSDQKFVYRGDNPWVEVYTTANCLSKSNEANATTGLAVQAGTTAAVESTVIDTGTYAYKIESNTTPTAQAGGYIPFAGLLTVGKRYTYKVRVRHVGSGGAWKVALGNSSGDTNASTGASYASTATTYATLTESFIYDGVAITHLVYREFSVSNDGGLYLDALEISEVKELVTAAITAGNTYDLGIKQTPTGASISLDQTVTTDATMTSNHTPAATLAIGDNGSNSNYFRGRLQQQTNLDAFAFADLSTPNWYAEDI